MEKTNELNKFLSYIHMGNSIFRIYLEEAEKLDEKKLMELIKDIQEIFKKHEESISQLIESFSEKATDGLSFAGIMGIYKEKMKTFNDVVTICTSAIKATYMGMISSIKFLDENKNLDLSVKKYIIKVIDDYGAVADKIKEFILNEYR